MSKRLFLVVCMMAFVIFGLVFSPCIAKEKAPAPKYNFICQSIYAPPPANPNDPKYMVVNGWSKEIEKLSGGRVSFKWHHSSELIGMKELFRAVEAGTIDAGIYIGYYGNEVPEIDISSLPFLFIDWEQQRRFFKETEGGNLFREALANRNIIAHPCMSIAPHGFIIKQKKVAKVEDFAGLKAWTSGAIITEFQKGLGMSSVAVPPADVYTSLMYGTINIIYFPYYTPLTYKLHEVTKYMVRPEIISGYHMPGLFMNLKKWNALPQDIKDIFAQVNKRYDEDLSPRGAEALTKEGMEFGLNKGMEMIKLRRVDYEKMLEVAKKKSYSMYANKNQRCAKILEIALQHREKYIKEHPEALKTFLEKNLSD